MKKLLSIIAVVALSTAFVACGPSDKEKAAAEQVIADTAAAVKAREDAATAAVAAAAEAQVIADTAAAVKAREDAAAAAPVKGKK